MLGNVAPNVYINWYTLKFSTQDPLELRNALFLIPSSHTIIVLFGKVGTVGIYGVNTRCRFQPIVLPQPLTGISQKAYHPAWKTLKILF